MDDKDTVITSKLTPSEDEERICLLDSGMVSFQRCFIVLREEWQHHQLSTDGSPAAAGSTWEQRQSLGAPGSSCSQGPADTHGR